MKIDKEKRDVMLATTTSVTTTYAGEFAGDYIAAALLSAKTLEDNNIVIKPNVKYKQVVKKVATAGIVKDATCDFTDVGTVTLTERILEPERFAVNVELCKDDFYDDWEAMSMGYGLNEKLPANFADFMIGEVAAQVADATEKSIWQGDTGTSGEFDGFEKITSASAAAGTGVHRVSGSAITSANVVASLGLVEAQVSSSVYAKSDFVYYVADNVARAYTSALGALGIYDQYYVGDKPMNFNGKDVIPSYGMSDNWIIATQKSNLWFGTGLMNDFNQVKVLDMADLDGSSNVRIVMRYSAGVQFGNASEIVIYKIDG